MRELKVQPIRNGTVIDHITPGQALRVLRVLGLPRPGSASTISIVINVPSREMKRKDIVKVEDRELDPAELAQIALIAPRATINIIREYHVAEKHAVTLPDKVAGIATCPNTDCVTRGAEPVEPAFDVLKKDPVTLRCAYCETAFVYEPPQPR